MSSAFSASTWRLIDCEALRRIDLFDNHVHELTFGLIYDAVGGAVRNGYKLKLRDLSSDGSIETRFLPDSAVYGTMSESFETWSSRLSGGSDRFATLSRLKLSLTPHADHAPIHGLCCLFLPQFLRHLPNLEELALTFPRYLPPASEDDGVAFWDNQGFDTMAELSFFQFLRCLHLENLCIRDIAKFLEFLMWHRQTLRHLRLTGFGTRVFNLRPLAVFLAQHMDLETFAMVTPDEWTFEERADVAQYAVDYQSCLALDMRPRTEHFKAIAQQVVVTLICHQTQHVRQVEFDRQRTGQTAQQNEVLDGMSQVVAQLEVEEADIVAPIEDDETAEEAAMDSDGDSSGPESAGGEDYMHVFYPDD